MSHHELAVQAVGSCYNARPGEVAEWSNVPDSKSGVLQGTVGSNPTLSANTGKASLVFGLAGPFPLCPSGFMDILKTKHVVEPPFPFVAETAVDFSPWVFIGAE